jgi:AcrR family transcriptional regulator
MHSVTQSATPQLPRGEATAREITAVAQRLADERGYDGFTMDELAQAAGVSRRTLFNHVTGKLEAVLGPLPEPAPEALSVFRAGGPHGDLVRDLAVLADGILDASVSGREELARARRLLTANPKLLAATHDRFHRLSEVLVDEVAAREGASFGALRARVAIGVLACLFDTALTAFLEDHRRRALTHHFDETIRLARELFA